MKSANKSSLELIIVLSISVIVTTLSILHVFVGHAKTPPTAVYMATGHYYLDYYYYLQPIAQGMGGNWIARQYSATDDASPYPHLEPYILIGQLGRLFHLSAIAAYWLAVFLITFSIVVVTYYVINLLLTNYSFLEKIAALFLTFSATPFYIIKAIYPLQIVIYEFWFSPSNFFSRLTPVPHHLLASLIVLIAVVISTTTIDQINHLTVHQIIKRAAITAFLTLLVMTFSPFLTIVFFGALFLTTLIFLLLKIKESKKRRNGLLFLYLAIILILVVPASLTIKYYYDTLTFTAPIKEVEAAYYQFIPFSTLLLNIGPLLLFFPLGLRAYLKDYNAIRLFFLCFVLISYGLFQSNIAKLFNTHNGRFLSPLSYILFGVLAVLGIRTVSKSFRSYRSVAFFSVFMMLFLIFMPVNIMEFERKINDKNIFTPITYLPKDIITGFKFLKNLPDGAVLTTPSQFLGVIIPTFSNKKVYIARPYATPNYEEKALKANRIYNPRMNHNEARQFLKSEKIKYVILTSIEGYDGKILYDYPFLREIYKNRDIVIFKVQ